MLRVLEFIEHCLPSRAERPRGPGWVHEIKHDGFRLMVRRDSAGIRLITRNGHDWSGRFPLIAEAANALKARSFLLDGEAVACDGDGMPSFDRLRYGRGWGRGERPNPPTDFQQAWRPVGEAKARTRPIALLGLTWSALPSWARPMRGECSALQLQVNGTQIRM